MADGFQPFPIGQVPQVDASNLTNAIGQAIQRRRTSAALQALMNAQQSGDPQAIQSATAQLIQYSPQMAQMLIKPITPYEKADIDLKKQDIELKRDKERIYEEQQRDPRKYMSPTMRDFCTMNPDSPHCRGASAEPMRLGPAEGTQVAGDSEMDKFLAFKEQMAGKIPTAQAAGNTTNIALNQMDMFRNTAESIQSDPKLPEVTGRLGALGDRYPTVRQIYDPSLQALINKTKTLGAEARSNIMQMYREMGGGKTGFGRVLLKEWENFGEVLAPLDRSSDTGSYRAALQRVINFSRDSSRRIRNEYEKQYGQKLPDVPTAESVRASGFGAKSKEEDWTKKSTKEIQSQARDLAQTQGMTKDQIIKWFADRNVTLEP